MSEETKIDVDELLKSLFVCDVAREWARGKTPYQAWRTCQRGEWLIWIASNIGIDRRLVVHCACDCAERALRFVPEGEARPRLAIEAARRVADDPSEANRKAAWEAWEAARVAWAAEWAAEWAARAAEWAAWEVAWAAEWAAEWAARAAEWAAWEVAWAAARAAEWAATAAWEAREAGEAARGEWEAREAARAAWEAECKEQAILVRRRIAWKTIRVAAQKWIKEKR